MIKKLLQIFLSFFKIGAFTFGGGYAMIPLIQRESVEKHKWVTEDDILDIVAIAESTPGPIAINSATFVGYRAAGLLGSLGVVPGVLVGLSPPQATRLRTNSSASVRAINLFMCLPPCVIDVFLFCRQAGIFRFTALSSYLDIS